MNKTECVKTTLKSAPLKYNQHKPVFYKHSCVLSHFFLLTLIKEENFNISNIIIIMSIIIITVQKYAQTPRLN